MIVLLVVVTSASAKTISLDNGNITFEAPDEFKPVPQEILDIKYPSKRAPRYVIGNESAATTIAYDLKPNSMPQDKINEAREAFSQMFPRMIPGIEWKENWGRSSPLNLGQPVSREEPYCSAEGGSLRAMA